MDTPPHHSGADAVDALSGTSGICDDGVARIAVPASSPAAVVDYLSRLDIETVDADTALDVVSQCEKILGFVHAVELRGLARFARLRPPPDPGRSFDQYAADAPVVAWTRNAAAGRIAHAQTLTDRLPAALHALERGEVDLYRTRILAEDTTPLDDQQAAAVADQVLERAAGQNATAFRRVVRRAVLRVDPGGADRRHETARAHRRVALAPLRDGMAELIATLPADHATAVYQRVDTLARANAAADDGLTADARRADALVNLILDGRGGSTRATAPLVQVTIAATTLTGDDNHPGDLAGYGPVPAGMARQIAADPTGTWRRLVTDPVDGTLLDYGRRAYKPPTALADHVKARDATCRFAGCHHPARHTDLDHTVPYPKGPTTAGNLGALCRRHHILKHRTKWTLTQQGGHFTWTSPTGRTYTDHPASYSDPVPESHTPP